MKLEKRHVFTVACSIALSSFVIVPVFAQQDFGGRDRHGNGGRNEVRNNNPGHRDDRGNMAHSRPNVQQGNRPNPGGNGRPNPGNFNPPRPNPGMPNNRWDAPRWPRRGAIFNSPPMGGSWRVFNGNRYMFHRGFFYRSIGGSFVVVAPPIGFRINILPVGFMAFTLGNLAYYYYGGAYYQRTLNNEFVVVRPPLGALVQNVPEGGEQVQIDGNTYYIVDGVQYQAVMNNGSIWYQVIRVN